MSLKCTYTGNSPLQQLGWVEKLLVNNALLTTVFNGALLKPTRIRGILHDSCLALRSNPFARSSKRLAEGRCYFWAATFGSSIKSYITGFILPIKKRVLASPYFIDNSGQNSYFLSTNILGVLTHIYHK